MIKNNFFKSLNNDKKFKKLKTNPHGIKGDYHTNNIPNTRHLTRIIMSLKDIKEKINQSQIVEFSGIEHNRLKGALIWLINNKIICKISSSDSRCGGKYYLNPKWLALENEE